MKETINSTVSSCFSKNLVVCFTALDIAFFECFRHITLKRSVGFYSNIKVTVRVKPVNRMMQIRIIDRKEFLLIVRLHTVCGENDCFRQKSFVNIPPHNKSDK